VVAEREDIIIRHRGFTARSKRDDLGGGGVEVVMGA